MDICWNPDEVKTTSNSWIVKKVWIYSEANLVVTFLVEDILIGMQRMWLALCWFGLWFKMEEILYYWWFEVFLMKFLWSEVKVKISTGWYKTSLPIVLFCFVVLHKEKSVIRMVDFDCQEVQMASEFLERIGTVKAFKSNRTSKLVLSNFIKHTLWY